jgi:putative lipoic acid-binding regulatory protein
MTTTSESIWQFPCDFPIKVVGKAGAEFEAFVLSTIRKHIPDLKENALELRPSKDGRYLAMTITVHATSKEQLDTIYRELTANKLVIMAL